MSCRPCIPTNYRGVWICETCSGPTGAPAVPAEAYDPPSKTVLRLTDVDGETAEAAAMAWLIQRPAGYDIDMFGGLLTLRGLEGRGYAVSWDNPGSQENGEEEFDDALAATRRFLELRKERQIGLDFETTKK
jgi:hypothetical protein